MSPLLFYDIRSDHDDLHGNLPHWRQGVVTYFVTFRTADSLPQEKLGLWRTERDAWLKLHPEPHDDLVRQDYHRMFTDRIQYWLDQEAGECLLNRTEIRQIVESALRHFDGQRYHLDDFVVAANHVHVVVTPMVGHQLSDVVHCWKSFTSHAINKATHRDGAFWQKESFDHIVRSMPQLERIRRYIDAHHGRRNPR